METRTTRTVTCPTNFASLSTLERRDELVQKRLDALLAVNAEIAREKLLFGSDQEKTAAAMMKNPLSVENSFAYFGLLLGILTPAAMFIKFFSDAGAFRSRDFWILGVLAVINLITAIVGYFSGKLIAKIVAALENLSWSSMILTLPFIGILWGILAGGAGGVIVFVIGAFFGAFLGAAVGSVALPAFAVFHRLLKKGDKFDRKHFLPIAFGITFIVSAFILGM